MPESALVQPLSSAPVAGTSLENAYMVRLDRLHPPASGNKYFKLKNNLQLALDAGVDRIVSFGGAWSNHLHALAALGAEQGLETVGIVRGEKPPVLSATLADARRWGMQLEFVSRKDYRRRKDADFLVNIERRFAPCLLIPEGGGNAAGVQGCREIATLIEDAGFNTGIVALACGTGTTLAGLSCELSDDYCALGIAVLNNAAGMGRDVALAIAAAGGARCDWRIEHQWHHGGYARVSHGLRQFLLEFESVQGIPLDPVYTGKLMYALYQLQVRGDLDAAQPLLAIHTGGLQGRRGFPWLEEHTAIK